MRLFKASSREVSGFRLRQKPIAERVKAGDIFVCYQVRDEVSGEDRLKLGSGLRFQRVGGDER
jgi:hypothetical protein